MTRETAIRAVIVETRATEITRTERVFLSGSVNVFEGASKSKGS
jgi:hypothetical protein